MDLRPTPSSALIILCLCALFPRFVLAEPAVVRNFDGPQTTWRLVNPRPGFRIVSQGCVTDDAREGTGSERIIIAGPAGESVPISAPVEHLPVLDELECRIWIKANRPGVTLAAQVVLPRALDPATRAPRTLMVQGSQYDQVGRWQQLSLTNVPKRTADEVRIRRAASNVEIDAHEAYVDAVILALPGGPGTTDIWTDELSIDGITTASTGTVVGQAAAGNAARPPEPGWRQNAPAGDNEAARDLADIDRRGTTLFVDGKPFLSRGIQWNGEPLSFLSDHGFNTVWLNETPTPEQTSEAVRTGVWFICTPPHPDGLAASGLGEPLDRVLAWHLPTPADPVELDYTRRWAELVRQRDPLKGRPIVVAPQADWLPCSKLSDILVADHFGSTSLAAADYSAWFKNLTLVARPGTPFWASIPTQPGPRAREQAATLVPSTTSSAFIDERQLEMLARTAAIYGSRGFLFQSDSPLDAADEITKRRALLLEAVNRQLQLIEPWLTLGRIVGQATAIDASTSALVLQVERARLLVPLSWSTAIDALPARSPSSTKTTVALVVPGVPESNDAFLLTPAGLRPLSAKRVTGGVSIALKPDENGLIVLTDDRNVATSLRQRLAHNAERSTVLARNLAAARAQSIAIAARNVKQLGSDTADLDRGLTKAAAELARCNAFLTAGNLESAHARATAARAALADAVDLHQTTVTPAAILVNDPFGAKFETLVQQAEFGKKIASLRAGDNRLDGGSFEDLGQLKQSGWQHVSDPIAGVTAHAELATREPHDGQYCLELSANADPGSIAPQVLARPPVWITSPPVYVDEGMLLEISGWIRVAQPIVGSIDGLTIVDSLGGPELAIHVKSTSGWQPFRMIRGVPQTTDVTIRFVLSGLGAASIDGVAIRELAPPSLRRLPEVTHDGPAFPRAARRPDELFAPPPVVR